MTLFHLLNIICLIAPIQIGFDAGRAYGMKGALIGAALGIPVGLLGAYAFYRWMCIPAQYEMRHKTKLSQRIERLHLTGILPVFLLCTVVSAVCSHTIAKAVLERVGPAKEFTSNPAGGLTKDECIARGGRVADSNEDFAEGEFYLGKVIGMKCPCSCVGKRLVADLTHPRKSGAVQNARPNHSAERSAAH